MLFYLINHFLPLVCHMRNLHKQGTNLVHPAYFASNVILQLDQGDLKSLPPST